MGDISTGSHTPSMVSNVLEWRKNNQDEGFLFFYFLFFFVFTDFNDFFNKKIAKELWDNLGEKNDLVVKLFQDLEKQSKNNETEYLNSIEKCSTTNFTQVVLFILIFLFSFSFSHLFFKQWKDLILEGSQTIKLIYQLYEAFQVSKFKN